MRSAETALSELDELVEWGRSHRSEETDELVLRRRFEAATQLVAVDGPLPQPPDEDPFAGVAGLVEIEASQLTASCLASALLRHGALLVRGLVPPKRIVPLEAGLDRKDALVAAASRSGSEGYRAVLTKGAVSALRARLPKMACTPSTLFDLIEIYKDLGVGEIIAEYLGARPVLVSDRARISRQRGGPGSALPWHQDAAFWGGVLRAVNIWLALTPCGVDAPALDVIPRRIDEVWGLEHGEEPPLPLAYGARVRPEAIEEIARPHGVASPIFEPGDALLFDEFTIHRTSTAHWNAPHKDVAVTWFFASSRVPTGFTPFVF